MQRVNVVGTSGSGKSTLGERMAAILGCEYLEMDALYWGPYWSEPTDAVFFERLEKALAADAWVLDGNYSRTTDIKWRRADTVVWLDYGFCRTCYQALKRAIGRLLSRGELWPGTGNRETFSKTFLSKDSILLWTLTSYHRNRRKYRRLMSDPAYSHLSFIRLRSPAASRALLDRLKERRNAGSTPGHPPG